MKAQLITFLLAFVMAGSQLHDANAAFRLACANGHTETVIALLRRPQVNPAAFDNEAIRLASRNGHTDVVRLLLERPEVNPAAHNDIAIRIASSVGHIEIVSALLGRHDVNPAALDNQAIRLASLKGRADVVTALLRRPEVNPAALDNEAIRFASIFGKTDVVRLLLERPDVDPAALDNEAIRLASQNGHTDVVRLLLERPEVNPTALDNEAIRRASIIGKADVLRLLLERPGVDPAALDNQAIRLASHNGHTDVVRMLLERPDVDPAALDNQAIRLASHNGHTDVVRLLLEKPEVNPGARDNWALFYAVKNGHTDVLKLLLESGRVDPSANNNELLSRLRNANFPLTKELLEQDARVKAIEFLKRETNPLTTTTFLNLFNPNLKLRTSSYLESIFTERPNALVATFISDLLKIPLNEAKAIKNLDDFDRYIYKLHKDFLEAVINQETILLERKFEFLWRYYSATLEYKNHFSRFQEIAVSFVKNHPAKGMENIIAGLMDRHANTELEAASAAKSRKENIKAGLIGGTVGAIGAVTISAVAGEDRQESAKVRKPAGTIAANTIPSESPFQ